MTISIDITKYTPIENESLWKWKIIHKKRIKNHSFFLTWQNPYWNCKTWKNDNLIILLHEWLYVFPMEFSWPKAVAYLKYDKFMIKNVYLKVIKIIISDINALRISKYDINLNKKTKFLQRMLILSIYFQY